MFGLGIEQLTIIALVGLFLLGPERIPTAIKWVTTTLRQVRTMAAGAQEQLKGEIGPELEELRRQIADLQSLKEIQELRDLRDLHPRNLISKNILGDEITSGLTGGIGGLLGLSKNGAAPVTTGSGIAQETVAGSAAPPAATSISVAAAVPPSVSPQPAAAPAAVAVAVAVEPISLSKSIDDGGVAAAAPAPAATAATAAPAAAASPPPFDLDAT